MEYSVSKVDVDLLSRLHRFLISLSHETKSYFAPHAFDEETLLALFNDSQYQMFVSLDSLQENITGYFVLRRGYFDYELERFSGYNCTIDIERDWQVAPVIGDQYQSIGMGALVFTYVLDALKDMDIHQLVLWGGVQANNTRARKFYEKFGFKKVGEYEYYGLNIEMTKRLS